MNQQTTDSHTAYQDEPNPEPSRVVMVAACPFPANHGTPGAIRELALNLVRQGHEVHVVTYPQYQDIPTDGIIIHRVSAPFMKPGDITIGPSAERLVYDFFLIPKLVQVIRKYNIEIIHTHNYEATIAGAVAKLFTRRPMVYTGINSMHDELPTYVSKRTRWLARGLGKTLDYLVPRTGNALMVLSDELKEYLTGLGVRKEKIVVIPPGVEVEMFAHGEPGNVRSKHNLDADTPVVLYTGALERFQRVDYLISAMVHVLQDVPDAKLLIVGNILNETARDEYKQQAADLGIQDSILFIDAVSLNQLPDYLAAGDVAVVPRPSCPGYPIKLLNYMAAGKAIVSFAGSAKAICHGFNGYVAENHNVADLAEGIKLLLTDKVLRNTLGQRARDSIPGVFDWETLAKGTAVLYDELKHNKGLLNRKRLGEYLKASYVPRCAATGLGTDSDNDQFLQQGLIEYPSFCEED